MHFPKKPSTKGFTVIELMIALSVLSIMLVLSSVILIQIGAIFTKGVSAANLQNANRAVISDISQAIQFGGQKPLTCTMSNPSSPSTSSFCYNSVNGTNYSYCVDTTRYTFKVGFMLGEDDGAATPVTTKHILWRDTLSDANDPCAPLDLGQDTPSDAYTVSGSGQELMPDRARLTRFYIYPNSTSGVYDISIWTAAGPSDLVNTNLSADKRTVTAKPSCKSTAGSQFCAVSNIDTQVIRRRSN